MKTITSLFLIAEQTRLDLAALAEQEGTSINNLIIEAINKYLMNDDRVEPMDPPQAARQFSVRMPDYLKNGIFQINSEYRIKLNKPISNNMILNTALHEYLKEKNATGTSNNHKNAP